MPQWPQFQPSWPGFALEPQAPLISSAPADFSGWHLLVWSHRCRCTGFDLGSETDGEKPRRPCSACGSTSHDRRNCSHTGHRLHFSWSIPRSKRCECCGQYYETQRHHPRGRADDSDWLDVSHSCHLNCCHKGDYNNFARKPRFCLYTGTDAYWRPAP